MPYNIDRRSDLACGLKSARRNMKLTAASASKLISAKGVKCARGTLVAWERGNGLGSREPFASDLPIIAGIYECDVADLFRQPPTGNINQQFAEQCLESASYDTQLVSVR